MSMATASIRAPLGRNRFQDGFRASAPLPSPTNTTAPLSRSITTVMYRWPLATAISSMAIRRRCLSLGRAKRRARSRFWMSLTRSQPTFRCAATSRMVIRRESSSTYRSKGRV